MYIKRFGIKSDSWREPHVFTFFERQIFRKRLARIFFLNLKPIRFLTTFLLVWSMICGKKINLEKGQFFVFCYKITSWKLKINSKKIFLGPIDRKKKQNKNWRFSVEIIGQPKKDANFFLESHNYNELFGWNTNFF